MTVDLTTQTPAEIDQAWQEALLPAERLRLRYEATRTSIKRYEERYPAGTDSTPKPAAWEVRAYEEDLESEHQQLVDYQNEFAIADGPFTAEWDRRGGWTRYYLVQGGKLHDYYCQTLNRGRQPTLLGLFTEASGLNRDEVVDKYQVAACTHCFPDAPVEVFKTPEQQGFCKYSGESIWTNEDLRLQLENLKRRYPKGWSGYMVARGIKCNCGGYPSLTSTDRVRKHKPGKPEL